MRKKDKYDVVCIGNAVVDIFYVMDSAEVKKLKVPQGSMHLINKQKVVQLSKLLPQTKSFAGGSAVNTAIGVASFGGNTYFIGKIHDDLDGRLFKKNLAKYNVKFAGPVAKVGAQTGRSLVMISPGGERTMLTYLGIASTLAAQDIKEEVIKNGKILFVEGYLWDRVSSRQAALHAMKIATKYGVRVALSLSDSLCVKRHKNMFKQLIESQVNILFGNKKEMFSMFDTSSLEELISAIKTLGKIAVVTLGSAGSIIINKDEVYRGNAHQVSEIIDTTGAGDLFTSGVLFGLSQDFNIHLCWVLGNLAAAENISHIGASPNIPLRTLL